MTTRYDLSTAYHDRFFRTRYRLMWRCPIVCQSIINILNPKSVIDLGCGTGDLVAWFNSIGISALGVDGAPGAKDRLICKPEHFKIMDLRDSIAIDCKFDLTICLEVAEHVEPDFESILLSNITKFSPRIMFSAAPPGCGGTYHVNLQTKEYWEKQFFVREFMRVDSVEKKFREAWFPFSRKTGITAFYENLMFFERK